MEKIKKNPKRSSAKKYISILEQYTGGGSAHEKITNSEHVRTLKELVNKKRRSVSNNGYRANVDIKNSKIHVIAPDGEKCGSVPFGSHIRPVVVRVISEKDKPVLDAIYFDDLNETFSFCRDRYEDLK